MSVTYSKTNGLYKDGICLKSFFKHDFETVALSAIRHDDGSISVDFHDSNGIRFIDVCDNDVDFLLSCDDPEIAFNYAYSLIPPSENTDNKKGDCSGVVTSEGEALFVKSVTPQYLNLMIPPADCQVIRFALDIAVELNAGCDPEHIHIKDFERLALFFKYLDYPEKRSKTPKLSETEVKLTESEINALLILVNTELDADDRIFELSELNAIRNKLLKASENFDLPSLLW